MLALVLQEGLSQSLNEFFFGFAQHERLLNFSLSVPYSHEEVEQQDQMSQFGIPCPKCNITMSHVDGHGPNVTRSWSCDKCFKRLAQSEVQVLHCAPCSYDYCHACEKALRSQCHSCRRPCVGSTGLNEEGLCDWCARKAAYLRSLCNIVPSDAKNVAAGCMALSDVSSATKFPHGQLYNTRIAAWKKHLHQSEFPEAECVRALEDCCLGSCGFLLPLVQSHTGIDGTSRRLGPDCGAALVDLLSDVVPRISKKDLRSPFPKRCSGCFVFNFLCLVEMYPNVAGPVETIFRSMLGDKQGVIVEPGEVQQLARAARRQYKRRDDPFPYMGNCIDFGLGDPFTEGVVRLGRLLLSEDFPQLMESEPSKAIELAKRFLATGDDPSSVLASH